MTNLRKLLTTFLKLYGLSHGKSRVGQEQGELSSTEGNPGRRYRKPGYMGKPWCSKEMLHQEPHPRQQIDGLPKWGGAEILPRRSQTVSFPRGRRLDGHMHPYSGQERESRSNC